MNLDNFLGLTSSRKYCLVKFKSRYSVIFKKATKFQTSSLQGSIDISYSDLLRVFGKEHKRYEEEGLKTDVAWDFEFIMDDSSVIYANIYNWKDGVNYLGPEGKEVEEITDWHIGGNSNQAVQLINTAIKVEKERELWTKKMSLI